MRAAVFVGGDSAGPFPLYHGVGRGRFLATLFSLCPVHRYIYGLAAVLEASTGGFCSARRGVCLRSRTDGGLFGLARLCAETLFSEVFV